MPTEVDHGWDQMRKIFAQISASSPAVKVGITGPQAGAQKEGSDAPLTLVEVAAFNEYGIGVPQRPFLSGTFDAEQAGLVAASQKVGQRMLDGKMTPRVGLEFLGHYMRNKIVERIVARQFPPENAPRTIARKGSSTPLVDKGQLKSGITHVVEGV